MSLRVVTRHQSSTAACWLTSVWIHMQRSSSGTRRPCMAYLLPLQPWSTCRWELKETPPFLTSVGILELTVVLIKLGWYPANSLRDTRAALLLDNWMKPRRVILISSHTGWPQIIITCCRFFKIFNHTVNLQARPPSNCCNSTNKVIQVGFHGNLLLSLFCYQEAAFLLISGLPSKVSYSSIQVSQIIQDSLTFLDYSL